MSNLPRFTRRYKAIVQPKAYPGFSFVRGRTWFRFIDRKFEIKYICTCMHLYTYFHTQIYLRTYIHIIYASVIMHTKTFSEVLKASEKNWCQVWGPAAPPASSLDTPLAGVEMRFAGAENNNFCLLYTSPSPRDRQKSRMPSSA